MILTFLDRRAEELVLEWDLDQDQEEVTAVLGDRWEVFLVAVASETAAPAEEAGVRAARESCRLSEMCTQILR
jgi:hypothetical protein